MNDTILIIGGDSSIGSALATRLRMEGRTVLETTRRHPDGDRPYLDLTRGSELRLSEPPAAAVLCAAMTSLVACRDDPATSRKINVENSLALSRALTAAGTLVVGLSTNLVFDGSVSRRPPQDPICPTSDYGRQKAELEAGLLALREYAAVFRLTKVLTPSISTFTNWAHALQQDKPIHPFHDMMMAPIPLDRVVEAIGSAITARASGIFQLSAMEDISYADAAMALCQRLGKPLALVQPVSSAASGIDRVPTSGYTSLDTARSEEILLWAPVNGEKMFSSMYGTLDLLEKRA
jgi:dTDP-4-dehydrorhamnose reductase